MTPPTYGECEGCGAWARASTCPSCAWETTPRAGVGAAPSPIRVLFHTVLTHSGELRLAAVHSARLRWIGEDTAWLDELRGVLHAPADGDVAGWHALRSTLESHAIARVRGIYDADELPTELARVALRVAVHAPGRDLRAVSTAGIRVVDFTEQMSRLASRIDPDAVMIDVSELSFSLDPARARMRAWVAPAEDLLVVGLRLVAGSGEVLAATDTDVFCPGGARVPIELASVSAAGLATISAMARARNVVPLRVDVLVHGLAAAISRPVTGTEHTAHLPAHDRVADLFVDIGAANTRVVLRPLADPDRTVLLFGATGEVLAALGVDQGYKLDGADVPAWVRRHVPAMAGWASTRHGTFLRHVAVGTESVLPAQPLRSRALLGDVKVFSEHVLLATYVAPLVAALTEAAAVHAAAVAKRLDKIATTERHNAHLRQVRTLDIERYEKTTGVGRVLADLGGDPRYRAAVQYPVPEPLPAAPAALVDLAARLLHVLALDLGAASVEWAVLSDGGVGGSIRGAGGDDVCRQLGLLSVDETPSEDVRRELDRTKAWMASTADDRAPSALRDALAAVYAPALTTIAAELRWTALHWTAPAPRADALHGPGGPGRPPARMSAPGLVVVTGGASADLLTRTVIARILGELGVDAHIGTPAGLLELLDAWKALGVDTTALAAPVLRARAWARQAEVDGDPFDLVEAMERSVPRG
jgi:hypothetical protein